MHDPNRAPELEQRRESLASMRHDLRTPISVIVGLAQVLQSELTDEEQKEDLAHIIANGQKLSDLIDEFVGLIDDMVGGSS